MKIVKIGELEVPIEYFKFNDEEKHAICVNIMNGMLTLLDKELGKGVDRTDILYKLLQSSIISNEMEESYEICEVLKDITTILLNE